MKATFKKILINLLQAEARAVLKKHKPLVVAITGSVGKTTTKDAVAAALLRSGNVRKSEKSYNSEIGIPLTVLDLKNPWNSPVKWLGAIFVGFTRCFQKNYPNILVLEVGADKPEDISSVTKWISADVVVFTQFAEVPVHIANFSSRQQMLEEKLSLLNSLKPGGTVVFNLDSDEFANAIEKKIIESRRETRVITYGLLPPADIIGAPAKSLFSEAGDVSGFSTEIESQKKFYNLEIIGVLGEQHIYPSLAGFAVGTSFGLQPEDIMFGLKSLRRQPGRMRLIPGIKGSLIIDDSYNSSPVASEKALATLKDVRVRGKRIAVLGDMLELGDFTEEEHKKMGAQAMKSADLLVTVGQFARFTAEGALAAGMNESNILQFSDSQRAGKYIEQYLEEGDLVLVKGSQGNLRMERVVLEIMAEPQKRKELLVRQEDEWLKR